MASITYDGQSFMLDGRRIWIVSGTIHYARTPRELWESRIHQARLAGLNTVEVPVVWSLHEQRPGQFDFKKDRDLRTFIELISEAGLYCILRPGPFIDDGVDQGGIPPWLGATDGVELRTNCQPFLEACSRYITALAGQVRDLQVTSAGAGGPIVLLQSECNWTCGDETIGQAYLGELHRYFREAGFTVPTLNSNDLYQAAPGEIDCWRGFDGVLPNLRQLGQVRPNKPRVLIDFQVGDARVWGDANRTDRSSTVVFRRLAEVLASGSQYNIGPFHGGTNFGFLSGREGHNPHEYFTASNDRGAPLTETGAHGTCYDAVRFVSTFASTFGRVLSHVDPKRQTVTLPPPAADAARSAPNFGIVHAVGSQGEVVFLFGDESGKTRNQNASLLLPDGTSLDVEMGTLPVVWVLFDTRLSAKARLDWSSLPVLGVAGDVLVCFGPAGSHGSLSINGSPLEAEVPRGKAAEIVEHEGVCVVIASVEQAKGIFLTPDGVYVGVADVAPDGSATPLAGARQYKVISRTGEVSTQRAPAAKPVGTERPAPTNWKRAEMVGHAEGSSARFASIEGPASLTDLGTPHGYGWYRVNIKSPAPGKATLMFPHARDRLQVMLDGEPLGVIGAGPGAKQTVTGNLKKGDHTIVLLADTLGRFSNGPDLGAPTGLFGHAHAVTNFKVNKPKVITERPIEILAFRTPLWNIHPGDATGPDRLTWTFMHRKKSPIIVTLEDMPDRGLVVLNGETIRFFEPGPATAPLVLDHETLNRGKNVLQIATLGDLKIHAPAIAKGVAFHEGTAAITEGADWAFAKWEKPAKSAFKPPAKKESSTPAPTWWSATFKAPAVGGLLLDMTGMTKGQIYVNGHHVCRYFVATDAGKAVPPQTRYYIPGPWLDSSKDNDLVIFDEHGGTPSKCKLTRVEDGWATEE